ncbi:CGNR zinc finger domain-containing protein [Gilliamella sp. B14448G11]|nr:CGNR zinc finger domain-containing protein [Gilliamella sp. B14448G7]MBI0035396.1 CGNR zinc finger domain-containing protein [Gilliamella sp. B14448G11]MBI0042571.1 CGNR zinc finger domain-containing protein [Gilliamella sp. B14448G12]
MQQKKERYSLDIEPLNVFLHKASRWLNLEYDANQSLIVTHHYAKHNPEQVLAPLAEATAKLIAQEDFSLVKHCEHKDCVLWFYDKTKAHKRRWCSMKN